MLGVAHVCPRPRLPSPTSSSTRPVPPVPEHEGPSVAAAEFSESYAGRVLQRSAFRSLIGRRRPPGSAISSVLNGLRVLPPRPVRPAPARRPESGTDLS
jgi:hypothetical protein